MNKLLEMKEWVTIPDAARHLSSVFDGPVSEADVLHLAMGNRLKLSVRFVNYAKAKVGKVVPYSEAKVRPFLFPGEGMPSKVVDGLSLNDHEILELGEALITLKEGLWDLPMIGNEALDIRHAYEMQTGGPEVTLQGFNGAFVQDTDGVLYQLQDSFDACEIETPEGVKKFERTYFPSGGLPSGSVVVVRTAVLAAFLGESSNPQLGEFERVTLQKQVATLALLLAEKSNLYRRGSKPNSSQISKAINALIDELPNADPNGLGRSTLGENISAGIRHLKA